MTTVTFNVKCKTAFGEDVAVVGCLDEFGSWELSRAVPLHWTDNFWWSGAVKTQSGDALVEFKFVRRFENGHLQWEWGPNRVAKWPLASLGKVVGDGHVVINCAFDDPAAQNIIHVKNFNDLLYTKVMSFNLRYDNPNDKFTWKQRKKPVSEVILGERAEIVGVQEALPHMIGSLLELLNTPSSPSVAFKNIHYDFIGVGRNGGGDSDEHCAIFFNSNRFHLVDRGTFWLSDTPWCPSRGWNAACNRICTWGLFEDRQSVHPERHFLVFNTHLDHISSEAREQGMKVVLQKMAEFTHGGTIPAVLLGDFNASPKEEVITRLEKKLHRAKPKLNGSVKGTFHNFEPDRIGDTIDYIFYNDGAVVEEFEVVSDYDKTTEVVASDHRPVCAMVNFAGVEDNKGGKAAALHKGKD